MRTYSCAYRPDLWQDGSRDFAVQIAAWAGIERSESFVDILGDAGPEPRHDTWFRAAWSDEGLMFQAWLAGPEIWANQTERDSVIFHDNDFEIFLDPDGDSELYLEVEVNALNTVWDLVLIRSYRNGGPPLDSFDVKGLRSAVLIEGEINKCNPDNKGWWVQVQLPYRSLQELAKSTAMPPNPGDRWRINFSRVHWDTTVEGNRYQKVPNTPEHNWVWSPMGEVDMHLPDRWGELLFS